MHISKQQSKEISLNKDYAFLLLKRTEKLSSAIYMVTGLVSDSEPLKWKLREKNIILLSSIATLRISSTSEKVTGRAHVSSSVSEILSLLEVAFSGGIISEMNAAILKSEYKNLETLLHKTFSDEQDMFSSDRYLHDDLAGLFKSDTKEVSEGEQRELADRYKFALSGDYMPAASMPDKGQIKDMENKGHDTHDDVFYNKEDNRQTNFTPRVRTEKMRLKKDAHAEHSGKSHAESKQIKDKRKEKIIAAVRKKKSVTIKDILAIISDCGEKTIQRELQSLVKSNVLKKEGERRWSRYVLK